MRRVFPWSASIFAALLGTTNHDHPGRYVLDLAHDLVNNHQRDAGDGDRAPCPSADVVAADKPFIGELNACRADLVEQVDQWVALHVHGRANAPLHTETLGSVVERLAGAWVRADGLITIEGVCDRANVVVYRL